MDTSSKSEKNCSVAHQKKQDSLSPLYIQNMLQQKATIIKIADIQENMSDGYASFKSNTFFTLSQK